jgi:hypothetical protein
MKEHGGYSPTEMPPRESEHSQAFGAGSEMLHEQPGQRYHGRALSGEIVWVCISIVKPDQREEFARFVREVKAPAVRAVKPGPHATVRLLEPVAPNADGTWSFIWLMDPVLPGETYEIEPLFEEYYGHQQAVEHLRHWREMHVGDQLFYESVQSAPDAW